MYTGRGRARFQQLLETIPLITWAVRKSGGRSDSAEMKNELQGLKA
jgi:hypothetical protein